MNKMWMHVIEIFVHALFPYSVNNREKLGFISQSTSFRRG